MSYKNLPNYRWVLLLFIVFNYYNGQVVPRVEKLRNDNFHFDFKNFEKQFSQSRLKSAKISHVFIELPDEVGGKNVRFELKENSLTDQRLNNIITFDGVSADNRSSLKLSVFKDRVNAIIKTNKGYFYVEPEKFDLSEYKIYGANSPSANNFICEIGRDADILKELNVGNKNVNLKSFTNFPIGSQIRKFRMAIAVTGEFTQAFNGVTDDALAGVVNAINLINKIYESELSITFGLIAETTNKTLIFTDPNTDPFTVDPNFANAGYSQAGFNTLNSSGVLLNNKYDIGHTFNIGGGGGGTAGPYPCMDGYKARAWTDWGSASDVLGNSVNLTAHEIGHQFGAGHIYNASGGTGSSPTFCADSWSSSSAVEPGSGNTVMGYNGTCDFPVDQNIPGGRKDYFNARSLDQILINLQSSSTCFTTIVSTNQPPSANAGVDITIPKNTPFKLKGIANDPNDTNLSYTWEQADVATANDKGAFGSTITGAGGYTAVNSTTAPLFLSEQSTTTTERYFPKMKFVIDNQNNPPVNEAEALSMVPRNIKFRFTVRDNHSTNGGVDSDEIIVVVDNSGPLAVSYPNSTGIVVAANSTMNVTWDVNNTNNIKNAVNILLSLDGGYTYPITLASNVPNNGTKAITVPNVPATSFARIKVVAVLSGVAEFFDISDNNFTINSNCSAYSSYAYPTNSVTALSGSAQANLNMNPPQAASLEVSSFEITYSNANLTNNHNLIIYQNASMTTPYLHSTRKGIVTKFKVTESGSYKFTKTTGGYMIMSVLSGEPFSTSNFLGSSAFFNGTNISVYSSTTSCYLTAGSEYYLFFNNANMGATHSITVDGPGKMYTESAPVPGYSYTYVAIDGNNNVVATSPSADFTTLPPGTYTVQGISYSSSINVNTFINSSLSDIIIGGNCINIGKTKRTLIITGSLSTSNDSNNREDIKIYPNPVNQYLNIISKENIIGYEINDFAGRLIAKNRLNGSIINLENLTTGSYILILYNKEKIVYKTTIIKK